MAREDQADEARTRPQRPRGQPEPRSGEEGTGSRRDRRGDRGGEDAPAGRRGDDAPTGRAEGTRSSRGNDAPAGRSGDDEPAARRRDDAPTGRAEGTRNSRGNDARSGERDGREARRGRPCGPAGVAARIAAAEVAELTGHRPETVVSVEPCEGGWKVGVEVLESARIPDTTDILAVYEVVLNCDGELTSYRRTCRYARGQLSRDRR